MPKLQVFTPTLTIVDYADCDEFGYIDLNSLAALDPVLA